MHFFCLFSDKFKDIFNKNFFYFLFCMYCNYRDIIFVIHADNLYLHGHNSVTVILIILSFVNKIYFWS